MSRTPMLALVVLLSSVFVSCGSPGNQTETAGLPSTARERTVPAPTTPLEKGKAFLAENRMKEGVVVTSSGLQYRVLREGDGPKPSATDRVTVHYRGTLMDGTEFDSSYGRGRPATFGLNQVIRGWTEGLQLMSVGSQYRLFIPSNLAYGKRGAGNLIGPDETLIFDVQLLKIAE